MWGQFRRHAVQSAVLIAVVACFLVHPIKAQESAAPSASRQPNSASADELQALTASILELKSQLKSMNDQMLDLRKEQERSREEARELRKRLEMVQAHGAIPESAASAYGSPGATSGDVPRLSASSPAASSVETQGESPDRLSRMEENADFLDAKINEQYQTKVESGSKYRLRLSGIVLLNVVANRGGVDNLDFPQFAMSSGTGAPAGTFGGSLRQSQISLQGFGPDIAGAHTSADLKFDFAGGFPYYPNGVTTGLVRLRTGTVRMDWSGTSLVAGQDRLFFAPLAPTTLASLAVPALAYNGNLWSWTPQVRLEHTVKVSEGASLIFQGGILDSLTGELPAYNYDRNPTSGEASGQPAYATRVAWRQRMFGQQWTLGFGGYYARQNWEFGRNVDSWAGTTDLLLPLGKHFEFSGEFYRGRAVGGIGGGIGQSIVLSGDATNPATIIQGLNSMGGWAQLKFKPLPKLEFNGAFGQDNPFASQLRQFPSTGGYFDSPLARNRSGFINFIYQVRSDFLFSLEYRRLSTLEIGGDSYQANHINLSLGYVF
jgi:hypothetical protein